MINRALTILEADVNVAAAATGGIWLEEVPQSVTTPHVVILMIDGDTNDSKNSVSTVDQVRFTVTSYAKHSYTQSDAIGAYNLIELCRTALDHYSGVVGGETLYIRAYTTPVSMNVILDNKQMKGVDMEFECYRTR